MAKKKKKKSKKKGKMIYKSIRKPNKDQKKKMLIQLLIDEMLDSSPEEGKKYAKAVLELDPDNISAYFYLGDKEDDDLFKSIEYFEKTVSLLEKKHGKDFFEKENKKNTDTIEFKLYMSAMHSLGDLFDLTGSPEKSIEIFEKMLKIDPSDKKNIRFRLSTLYLKQKDFKSFEKLISKYEDKPAVITWVYNKALFGFIKNGETEETNELLKKAHDFNKYVIDYMFSPELTFDDMIARGAKLEEMAAFVYVKDCYSLWKETKGALKWLRKFAKREKSKSIEININTSSMNMEKLHRKLLEIMKEQNIDNIEEAQEFLNKNIIGKSIQEITEEYLDNEDVEDKEELAQDMVLDAFNLPKKEGMKIIRKVLELDPENPDAYTYMGNKERNINKAAEYYKKAVSFAEKKLGKDFFEENEGHFWGIIETRPYMRAMDGLANSYLLQNKQDEAIKIYEKMLKLNPTDNQGVRYSLSVLYLEKKEFKKFEELIEKYGNDISSYWPYNQALYSFIKEGVTERSNELLKKAYKRNPYVIDFLLKIKPLPNHIPPYIEIGGESEAVEYVYESFSLWVTTKGALKWLKNFVSEINKKK